MNTQNRRVCLTLLLVVTAAVNLTFSAPAQAQNATPTVTQSAGDVLDPATFSGAMEVATPYGNYLVDVEPGDAARVAEKVREAAATGDAEAFGPPLAPGLSCGDRINSVAGPGTYWDSVNGCAVFGYPGYQRGYRWYNTSSVTICASGRGYNSKGAAGWYTAGCLSGGASTTRMVPWGNVLSYTKMSALSVSTVTGASYQWNI